MRYAGFWKRAIALVLDLLILSVVGSVGVLITRGRLRFDEVGVVGEGAGAILTWIYYAGFESSEMQATVGKMAIGIKVTDLYGARISFVRATGRHFGKILSGFICGIGFLMAAFTERNRRPLRGHGP
jgi:uncharacterized RDD family membrane protein YckC